MDFTFVRVRPPPSAFSAMTQKLGEGIFLIDARMFFPGLASVYVVAGKKDVALVETGLSSCAPEILDGLSSLGFRPEDITYVIVTHAHLDHAGSAGILLKTLPRAKVVVHEVGAPHMINPTRILNGARRALGDKIADKYRLDLVLPVEASRVMTVKGGETIDLGGRRLDLIATPGHCPHHISPYEPALKALFTGDVLGTYNQEFDMLCPTTPAPEFNLRITLETINKIRAMDIDVLYFSHFGASGQVNRLFDEAVEKHSRWGEVVLKAKGAGLGAEHIYQSLFKEIVRDAPFMPEWLNKESGSMYAQGYLVYYDRENNHNK